jgi:AMIN domain
MTRSLRAAAGLLVWAAVCFPAPTVCQAQTVPSIRRVQVQHTQGQVEVEIEASESIVPRTNVITNPDRLIVDFVNAVPGAQLHNQTVSRGEVKGLRVGLFSSDPPVTRVVIDLNSPQPYQVFPSGKTVIVKVGVADAVTAVRSASPPALVNTNYPPTGAHLSVPTPPMSTPPVPPPPPPKPALEVSFRSGLLSINSNKATLSEVLFAIHQQTGAEIAIPAGAEQEQVVLNIGPAPAPEVLSQLLNGSRFNFLILSSSSDPHILDRVILSSRPEGPTPPPPPRSQAQARPVAEEDSSDADVGPRAPSPPPNSAPPPDRPAGSPETKAPGDGNGPN